MPEPAEAITSRPDLNVEAKLRAAFELSPTVLTITADGRFVDLNDGFVRLHGYAREDGIGRAVSGLNRTGHGQAEERARALEAGFDRHLTKPVDPVVLEALVGSVSRSPD